MFAIMGANGQTGGAALAALRGSGKALRAIVRDTERAAHLAAPGVALVAADMADLEALTAALSGVEAAYLLNPAAVAAPDVLAAAAQTAAIFAEAIRRAKVPHVVALSSSGAHLASGSGVVKTLHDFEAALRATGAPVTFLRPADFMENWGSVIGVAQEHGVLPSLLQPLDRRHEMVSAHDVGAAVAEALLHGPAGERIVHLAGPAESSAQDAAEALTELLGKPVSAVATPRAEWEPELVAAGLGESYARELAALYDGINSGRVAFEPGVGETRRGAITLHEALRRLLARGP